MSIQISCCKDFPKCIIDVLKLPFTSEIQCKIFYRKKWWVTLHPKRRGEMASEKKRLTTLLIYNIWRLKRVFIWQRKIKFGNSDALSLLEICTVTLAFNWIAWFLWDFKKEFCVGVRYWWQSARWNTSELVQYEERIRIKWIHWTYDNFAVQFTSSE